MQSVDVAIVGGGMVGLAVACGLQGSGLRVAVLEQRVPEPLAAVTTTTARFGYQCRQRKITHRSWRLAGHSPRRASCYHGMEVRTKTVLVTFRLTIKAWAIAILGISSKTQ
ncbi:FAD-dependent oxidoreductase [Shigella flexneri]